ncbi:MAG: dihydroorotate dehydrogenase electron transfer subunit [Clostridiales bacterium]|jgi:dihydroorotate dehydrogenase electron transfer subunit|nr:dihydroorotate dehydrogenase electron transfer subunit [Clostridiales bacterium]
MRDVRFKVENIRFLSGSVFELTLLSAQKLPPMRCGQFLHIETPDRSKPLRRPFCLYKFGDRTVTLAAAVVGGGTAALSRVKKGDVLNAVLPLGNGFTLGERHKKAALIGGGLGCAPLLSVPDCYPKTEYRAFLGFADKASVLFEREFAAKCKTVVSTDDGGYGVRGFVTDAFADSLNEFFPDVVLTCGPPAMLKAVAALCAKNKIPAFVSTEERMGCGVGACLVCACALKDGGGVKYARVCADGPVFALEDLAL